ncbi:hypothetical protein A500_19309 [Clostridium sartagoforme AAU1]|uniref:Uncharacterized protein n=1 Tax=Clostridium sartagoforme AAU1 TaxID=1202534 RepID=R9BSK8_9CLOT|nr:hypothetical protein [Clostridium sartagoforme]EOR19992.1 hypothetical protein A500_19309 [Clostridium sartagoforme AAU1]
MARGRKTSTIKVVTGRDRDLIKQLSKTGLCNSSQSKEYCGVSVDRLKKLEKSGYIKTSEHIARGENNLIIQLDKGGKEYCRQEFGITNFCAAQTNHLEHDIKLTEVYYKLDDAIRDTWKHERELIDKYYEMYPEKSGELKTCIDAAIEVNGELIAIESIGTSYTGTEIELKQEIATNLGCSRMECF